MRPIFLTLATRALHTAVAVAFLIFISVGIRHDERFDSLFHRRSRRRRESGKYDDYARP